MKCTIEQNERIASYKKCCDYAYKYSKGSIPYTGVNIIWCHTHDLVSLLNDIRFFNAKYIIVSHASDYGITKNIIDILPNNVVKLFSQNVICKDPRVESIPIGSIGSTWIGKDELATKHQDTGNYCHEFSLVPETGEEKKFENLVLLDFAIRTNPAARAPLYNHFKDYSWATAHVCDATFEQHSKTEFHSMEKYFKCMYNHKFVISPLGNGVDCGRNWQALYLGTIPIIPRHTNIEYYENDLPFLIFDDVNTLTEEFLNKKWEEMSTKKYNLEKATISYWCERFKEEKKKYE